MSTTLSSVVVIRSSITKSVRFFPSKELTSAIRREIQLRGSYQIFFDIRGNKIGYVRVWANNFLSVFDKFKREYRLAAAGRAGDYTSERMC